MRRSLALKTEFNEQVTDKGRFKLIKRKKTEGDASQIPNFQTQKYFRDGALMKKHQSRLSNQVQFESVKQKRTVFQQLANVWHEQIDKKDMLVSECNILRNYIGKIGVNRFKHQRNRSQPQLSKHTESENQGRFIKQIMQNKKFQRCCEIIDNIYKRILSLKQLGYGEAKINQWICYYCENKRIYMKSIFMNNVNQNAYSFEELYQYQKDSSNVKKRIRHKILKVKGQQSHFISDSELQDVCNYLQDILIQKNALKSKEIQQAISSKLSHILLKKMKEGRYIFTKKQPSQVYNFISDLSSYEQKYGQFVSFARVNKLRFIQLNKVERNLKQQYQEMIEDQMIRQHESL